MYSRCVAQRTHSGFPTGFETRHPPPIPLAFTLLACRLEREQQQQQQQQQRREVLETQLTPLPFPPTQFPALVLELSLSLYKNETSMVLVLAALYTYRHYYQQQQQQQLQQEESIRRTMQQRNNSNSNNNITHSEETVFSEKVRQRWIDAVLRNPAGDGSSSACRPSFHHLELSVVPQSKVGMILHRLALGLYVHHVEDASEAAYAGVIPGSLLYSIRTTNTTNNNHCTVHLLAEPTKRALHRIFEYQDQPQEGPIILQLLRPATTEMYSVVLWTSPWGISWASCGNFALVQRTYGPAAAAKVPRGSLLIRIATEPQESDENQRVPDHAEAAYQLQQALQTTDEPPSDTQTTTTLRITCAFPSPTLRTQDRPDPQKQSTKIQSMDGVEIKWHRLEYALCQANNTTTEPETTSNGQPSLEEILEQVSMGSISSPTQHLPYLLPYRYKPLHHEDNASSSLDDNTQLLHSWNALEAFLTCLQLDTNHYEWKGNTMEVLPDSNENHSQLVLQVLKAWSKQHNKASAVMDRFLLPAVSLLCQPSNDEMRDVMSVLLQLARKDESLCQRLYFVLRSYLSTLQDLQNENTSNLMALMHCLELLRFAEKDIKKHTPAATPETQINTTLSLSSSSTASFPERSPMPSSPQKKGFFPMRRRRKNKTEKVAQSMNNNKPTKHNMDKASGMVRVELGSTPAAMYDNMSEFLGELAKICTMIEGTLQKSFRQKIAEWALQPWSPSKDSAVAQVTSEMRESLRAVYEKSTRMLVNPVESTEILSSLDYDECYILPSAHFPLLLSFNMSETRSSDSLEGEQRMYETRVEILSVMGTGRDISKSYVVHAAVAGNIRKTEPTTGYSNESDMNTWVHGNKIDFTTRSSWGSPNTISLRLSCLQEVEEEDGTVSVRAEEIGFGWVNVGEHWDFVERNDTSAVATCRAEIIPCDAGDELFDEHGIMQELDKKNITLEVKISMKLLPLGHGEHTLCRKRSLLYKHGDDLRQEAFAMEFIRVCDEILRSSGLDMKLLTFQCMPVGVRQGFIEWVPGSVPMSEICQPFAGSDFGSEINSEYAEVIVQSPSMLAKAGLIKYGSLRRLTSYSEATKKHLSKKNIVRGSFANNPVQDYLRSVAFDAHAPYLVDRDVMDKYVKSCAGYCVITYILGVGDRHLDNLLLHQSGCLFHCDFSFILGMDPKKYLAMRITDDMIFGMGGKGSDNYVKFLSLAGAAFLALRRPESVRVLLSMIRLMELGFIPDVSMNQTTAEAIMGVRGRLCLDLTEQDAVGHIESVIEQNLSSKLWMAVDAIHSLGKQF